MTIQQKPFRSEFGFRSPSFQVDSQGNLTASTITASDVNATTVSVNGVVLLEAGRITENVVDSSLQTIGVLQNLTVNGEVAFKSSGVNRLLIQDGKITINSRIPGNIDNIDIGLNTPGRIEAYRIQLVDNGGNVGNLILDNANVSVDAAVIAGAATFSSPINISQPPTLSSHATRKDYVDNASIAFAVAFGA